MRSPAVACLVLGVVCLAFASAAPGAARLKSIQLSTDVTADGFQAVNVREVFDVTTPVIHGLVELDGVRVNSVLKGIWICVDAISVRNHEIDAIELQFDKSGPASAHISLSRPDNGWPPGNYRLDVYLDNQQIGSQAFSIGAASVEQPLPNLSSASPAEDAEALRAKLKALQAARQAGVLNDQEYTAKKADLEARLEALRPTVDPAAQKKLEALEAAYRAGVLTRQEYEQKKAAIVATAPRVEPAGQTVRPAPGATDDTPGAHQSVERPGRTFAHPAGFSFWYPTSWSLADQGGALQLVPAEAATSAEGPLELYFLATEDITGTGITSPSDAGVIEYLDEQVKSLSPILAYTGAPQTIQTDIGQGSVLAWQATSPDGRRVAARAFVVFKNNTAVVLVGMGLQERIDARDEDLRGLFQSISTGQPRAPSQGPAPFETRRAQSPNTGTTPAPLPSQSTPNLEQQRKALEAARQAGVLSELEYAAKVRELENERSPVVDAETQKKLDALESARRAGILSEGEYQQKKLELTGATGGEATPNGRQTAGPGVSARIEGKTYRHVIGFTFWYPADWTVRELDEALQLIPPDPGTTAGGDPTEVYFITGESVAGEGIARADDPRVVEYMDESVALLSSFLRRTDAPAPAATMNSEGVMMNWEGTSPDGHAVCARAYVSIIRDHGVALIALCFKEKLAERDNALRRMFASFAFGPGQLDPQLFGRWDFLTTQSITNWSPFETHYSRAQLAADTTGKLVLEPGGTWTRTDRTHLIAGAGGVWLESDDTTVSKGRWYAGSGSLYLIWEDDSWEDYDYEIRRTPEGVRLLLVSGQKGELWERSE